MPQYASRILSSLVSLVLLLVMVFFLSRLTGDPAALFLPIDATPEMIDQFRELHGLNDPLLVQFGRYVWDVLHLDFGDSLRQARPAIDVVLKAFVWTFWLAVITMTAGYDRSDRHRLARRLPAGRHLRPDRHLHLADRRLRPRLLDRHRRHHRLRHWPRLAANLRHRHGLALDPADRRAVHPAVRPDPAGRPRLDGAGLRLGLRQDRPRQGRAGPLDHLRPHAAGTPCCR